ncbi:hypothetical protein HUT11_04075 [Streptomyces seoulensis]|nr:hypothetical protein HUT11_04075 [Streptomyces seoulensis]
MHALRRRLAGSLIAQAALLFPLAVGIAALFRRHEHPLVWVINGAFYTAVGMASAAVQRRRYSRKAGVEPGRVADLNHKIRHREVPRDPEERTVMRRLVDAELEQMRRSKRWVPYSMGLLGLVAVGLLALGVATGSLTFPLVFAAAVIAFVCWMFWMRRRSMDRLHHMEAALGGRNEEVPASHV